MLAVIDVLFRLIKTFSSCLFQREKLPQRSWRGEFTFRLAKDLLSDSIDKDFTWIRTRQGLLTLYSPDLLKVDSQHTQIANVPCILLQTKKQPEPNKLIVYFHGGGYALGSAKGYQLMGAKLALKCQAKVVLVDYRLVPDFAMPAAQEDCYTVTQNLLDAYSAKNVVLMGDSAGGALCLSVLKYFKCVNNENTYLSRISATVLISPWVAPLSYKKPYKEPYEYLSLENEAHDMLDRHITQHWRDTFYLSDAQAKHVDFSNIHSVGLSKNEWPPLYIQAAGSEVFLKQIQAFSKQLSSLDVSHELDVFADQFHVFQTFSPLVPEANKALDKIADFVRSV